MCVCVRACAFVCVCVCVYVCVCMCVCVCFHIIPYVNCFGRTVLYVCIEDCIWANMYHVSAQGVHERMIKVHYYYNNIIIIIIVSCTHSENRFPALSMS